MRPPPSLQGLLSPSDLRIWRAHFMVHGGADQSGSRWELILRRAARLAQKQPWKGLRPWCLWKRQWGCG